LSSVFLGSGKLVKDYTLIIKYFEKLRELGIDPDSSYPRGEDLEEVKKLVEQGAVKSLEEALNVLKERFKQRIAKEAAVEAVREVLGAEIGADAAVEHVARLLALWTLEMGENMGIIKIVGAERYLR